MEEHIKSLLKQHHVTGLNVIGEGNLTSPFDLCIMKKQQLLAVADEAKGLVIFDLNDGQVTRRVERAAEAGSICYDSISDWLVVTSAQQPTGDPVHVQFYEASEFKLVKEIPIPVEPYVKPGYVRWICWDGFRDCYYVAYGDNQQACLWKLSKSDYSWKLILNRPGDLSHPEVISSDNKICRLLVTEWSEQTAFSAKRLDIDNNDKILKESMVVRSTQFSEPWSSAYGDNTVAIYDYQSGNAILYDVNTGQPIKRIGTMGGGQWVSMLVDGQTIYASCSDERVVYVFRIIE